MKTESRRMKRMSKYTQKKIPGLNLVSLMDVFTILVFFLLVNSASSDVMEPPKEISLPTSAVESKPRETLTIMITKDHILVQGEPMVSTEEAIADKGTELVPVKEQLLKQRKNVIAIKEDSTENKEVTILSDRSIPFKLVKKVMSSCTSAGFNKISLAVTQSAAESYVF